MVAIFRSRLRIADIDSLDFTPMVENRIGDTFLLRGGVKLRIIDNVGIDLQREFEVTDSIDDWGSTVQDLFEQAAFLTGDFFVAIKFACKRGLNTSVIEDFFGVVAKEIERYFFEREYIVAYRAKKGVELITGWTKVLTAFTVITTALQEDMEVEDIISQIVFARKKGVGEVEEEGKETRRIQKFAPGFIHDIYE